MIAKIDFEAVEFGVRCRCPERIQALGIEVFAIDRFYFLVIEELQLNRVGEIRIEGGNLSGDLSSCQSVGHIKAG